jgi:hypothetical protein
MQDLVGKDIYKLFCNGFASRIENDYFVDALQQIYNLCIDSHQPPILILLKLVYKSPWVSHLIQFADHLSAFSDPHSELKKIGGSYAKKRKRISDLGFAKIPGNKRNVDAL